MNFEWFSIIYAPRCHENTIPKVQHQTHKGGSIFSTCLCRCQTECAQNLRICSPFQREQHWPSTGTSISLFDHGNCNRNHFSNSHLTPCLAHVLLTRSLSLHCFLTKPPIYNFWPSRKPRILKILERILVSVERISAQPKAKTSICRVGLGEAC